MTDQRARLLLDFLALCAALAAIIAWSMARAETWYVTRPTTGAPCASFEWEAFTPDGFRYFHALTPDSTVGIPQGMWPGRARCRCWDDRERVGPWSDVSATYFPPDLARLWWSAGPAVRLNPLSMTVALMQATEAAWPDSLR